MTAPPARFLVLFVCTGNVCRSPAAERLFRARMAPGAQVVAASAGTHALVGQGIDPPSAQALRELGIDPSGHVARRVDGPTLRRAGLVLTATADQRGALLRSEPLMMSRTFTLREFVRLAGDVGEAGGDPDAGTGAGTPLARRVRALAGLRGRVTAPGPGADDIADPYLRPADVARSTVAGIAEAVDGLIRALGFETAWDMRSPGSRT